MVLYFCLGRNAQFAAPGTPVEAFQGGAGLLVPVVASSAGRRHCGLTNTKRQASGTANISRTNPMHIERTAIPTCTLSGQIDKTIPKKEQRNFIRYCACVVLFVPCVLLVSGLTSHCCLTVQSTDSRKAEGFCLEEHGNFKVGFLHTSNLRFVQVDQTWEEDRFGILTVSPLPGLADMFGTFLSAQFATPQSPQVHPGVEVSCWPGTTGPANTRLETPFAYFIWLRDVT